MLHISCYSSIFWYKYIPWINTNKTSTVDYISKSIDLGLGLQNQFSPFRYFYILIFSQHLKHRLTIEYHIHIWQVLPQLSCSDTHQLWKWFKAPKRYFSKIKYFFYGEINEYDDIIKWKLFPRYWPVVRGIHRWPVNSPHKSQWCGTLMFSFICAWMNGWIKNNHEADDLRRHRAHYDVIVMQSFSPCPGKGLLSVM